MAIAWSGYSGKITGARVRCSLDHAVSTVIATSQDPRCRANLCSAISRAALSSSASHAYRLVSASVPLIRQSVRNSGACLLYTSDAADEEDSVDLGGRR